jgi:hypothetical protein
MLVASIPSSRAGLPTELVSCVFRILRRVVHRRCCSSKTEWLTRHLEAVTNRRALKIALVNFGAGFGCLPLDLRTGQGRKARTSSLCDPAIPSPGPSVCAESLRLYPKPAPAAYPHLSAGRPAWGRRSAAIPCRFWRAVDGGGWVALPGASGGAYRWAYRHRMAVLIGHGWRVGVGWQFEVISGNRHPNCAGLQQVSGLSGLAQTIGRK